MIKKKNLIIIAAVLLVAALAGWQIRVNTPEQKAARFVAQNGSEFSELADSGQAIPEAFNDVPLDVWSGEHLMYEFVLGAETGEHQYWGVYYSPDDVPLSFQNADVPLLENGKERWTWQAEGDNHGTTQRIAPGWYYFEASF